MPVNGRKCTTTTVVGIAGVGTVGVGIAVVGIAVCTRAAVHRQPTV